MVGTQYTLFRRSVSTHPVCHSGEGKGISDGHNRSLLFLLVRPMNKRGTYRKEGGKDGVFLHSMAF